MKEEKDQLGRPTKFLTKEIILAAMSKTGSNKAAARYCHVSLPTYRKYAELYKDEDGVSLYDKHLNQSGKGIPKFLTTKKKGQQFNLTDLLEGRVPAEHFDASKIKERILHEGLLDQKCIHCGFSERRVLDLKAPLLLNHKDGNKHNYRLDNLEMVCYNCSFLYGRSPLSDSQVKAQEDYVESKDNFDWEIDETHLEWLKELELIDQQDSGSQYISRL